MIGGRRILGCLIALAALPTCTDDDKQMKIAVQKVTAAGCWALMTDDPIATDYPLSASSCAKGASPTLLSGSDRVRVVIDYDVPFETDKSAPPPTLHLFLDGFDTPTGAQLQATVDGNPRFALAELLVPSRPAQELRLTVDTPSGYTGAVSKTFSLEPPAVAISVAQCPANAACELAGGTGAAEVALVVPGTAAQTVILTSAVNNVEDTPPRTVDVSRLGAGVVMTTVQVPVPFARPKLIWQLTAHLGSGGFDAAPITLKAPSITSSIGCGSPCAVHPGATVGLMVTAEALIRATQATVRTFVDHVPTGAAVLLDLSGADVSKSLVFGAQQLTVPASGAEWQIDVDVGGYTAESIVAAIKP